MVKNRYKYIKRLKKNWDEHANRYDGWYENFEGAVEHYVQWELLKGYLPENRDASILDAAGGTGRITLPLAKMGYSVTLCDISPGMLNVAKNKFLKEGALAKVNILECDVCNLPFPDESFDFILCWDGMIEAAKELIRVTKRKGKVSIFLMNRYRRAIDLFPEDPESSLALIKSSSDYIYHNEEKHRAVSPEEARKLFEVEGIRVIDIYAVCGWMNVLPIPQEVLESKNWDEKFFSQVTEIILRLSNEPSIKGMARHLALYGEKI
ncbi:class I SAM-dependent methyltransferase [candidate division WOR-3 bacterium]|nr:class I SAM-dependent methyltransferase [candidate division WOR-3 bacterium]